jgi:serine/threonine-protein kinase
MVGETEIRAARLAVSRYGADPAQVQQLLQTVLDAQAQGEIIDLLDVFLQERVLSRKHADDLRYGLSRTQLDPAAAPPEPPPEAPTPETDARLQALLASFARLQQLGDYRILRRLGEGGMGAVFLAYDKANDRQVALKVLAPEHAGTQNTIDRFLREAESGRSLRHPNIVRLLEANQDPETGLHYLALEFIEGASAHDLLEQHGKLDIADAVHIALDIARALEYAHGQSIVHRDIKPGNILITPSGVAKLSDLGLAKRTDATHHLTMIRQGVGTPYYMPFEQALNAKRADARSDLYALGATLYHLVTGEVPFPGLNTVEIIEKKELGVYLPARSINLQVPESLERILARMLALRPEQRYQTASELIIDLEATGLAAGVPTFADRELALRDPLVRERLAALPSTALDVRVAAKVRRNGTAGKKDVWYVRCKDRQGRPARMELTKAQILDRLRRGKLKPRSMISRTGKTFKPLRKYAEFAAKLPPPAKVPEPPPPEPLPLPPRPAPWRWWVAAGVGVAVLTGTVVAMSCL